MFLLSTDARQKCNVEKQTCEWGDIGVTQWDCDPNALVSIDRPDACRCCEAQLTLTPVLR